MFSFFFISDTRDIPAIDLAFALSAAAVDADDIFDKMKNTVDTIVKLYGVDKIRYALVTFGDKANTVADFDNDRGKDALRTIVQNVSRPTGEPDVREALEEVEKLFENASPRPGSWKVLVVFIDMKSANSRDDIKEAAKPLIERNVTIIPATVGSEVNVDEIEVLVTNKEFIAVCPVPEPDTWPEIIIDKAIQGGSRN